MKACNPFVPTVPLITVPSRDHREKFRRVIYWVLGGQVAFLLLLLFTGSTSSNATGMQSSDASSLNSLSPASSEPGSAAAASFPPSVAPALEVASTTESPACATVSKSGQPAHENIHIVKAGDTLSRIARTYGTTVKAVQEANQLSGARLTVGAKLHIP